MSDINKRKFFSDSSLKHYLASASCFITMFNDHIVYCLPLVFPVSSISFMFISMLFFAFISHNTILSFWDCIHQKNSTFLDIFDSNYVWLYVMPDLFLLNFLISPILSTFDFIYRTFLIFIWLFFILSFSNIMRFISFLVKFFQNALFF